MCYVFIILCHGWVPPPLLALFCLQLAQDVVLMWDICISYAVYRNVYSLITYLFLVNVTSVVRNKTSCHKMRFLQDEVITCLCATNVHKIFYY